ncbi:DUF2461 domain-containing protein [Pedococcus sp. KACC 23699]|uniref:DUF2461 domain-containing protein n=1 Tax=Pedococcus sp. KACC 23699 TaxID=3149228 RepID=A0AAU7JSW6_9MICO
MAEIAAFAGFPMWGVEFYQDLEEDNTREFWAAHKAQWQRDVRDPMRALVLQLEDEFGPAKLFRPNRNLRFSADKSPYKTHQGALAGREKGAGWYLQLGGDGLVVGGGFRAHSPADTARYRAAVDASASGLALEGIVADLEAAGFTLEGATLKTRPKGFDADHPRLDLLRRKEMMALRRVGTPDWLTTPQALDEVRAAWRRVGPLTEWVLEHVATEE